MEEGEFAFWVRETLARKEAEADAQREAAKGR